MSMRGQLAVVVLTLELLSTRTARADADVGAEQRGLARRTKPVRLELTYVWPAPQPPAPPTTSAATSSATAPSPNAGGAQIALAVLTTIIGDTAGILVAIRTNSIAAGSIPMILAPLGGAALVCSISPPSRGGPATPAPSGRCSATLAGALIGTAAGLLPGMLLYATAGSAPNTEDAYHSYVQSQISGLLLALTLYTVAVPVGTIVGYNLGVPDPPTPVIVPRVAMAPLFTLRF
jgi:hypothetical protein